MKTIKLDESNWDSLRGCNEGDILETSSAKMLIDVHPNFVGGLIAAWSYEPRQGRILSYHFKKVGDRVNLYVINMDTIYPSHGERYARLVEQFARAGLVEQMEATA